MSECREKVVIDADFFRHTTDNEPGTRFFELILSEFDYQPVMHEYVARVELNQNERLESLKNNGKIEIIKDDDILKLENSTFEEYKKYFEEAYESLNKSEIGEEDILTYGYDGKHPKENLGEIRSFYLVRVFGYKIFVSDDYGSKELEIHFSSSKYPLEVKTLESLLVDNLNNNGNIRYKDIKYSLPKAYDLSKESIKKRIDNLLEKYKKKE